MSRDDWGYGEYPFILKSDFRFVGPWKPKNDVLFLKLWHKSFI